MNPEKNKKPLEDQDLEQVNAGTDDGEYRPLPDGKVITAGQPVGEIKPDPRPVRPDHGAIPVGIYPHDEHIVP